MVVTELMPAKEVPTISLTTIINRDLSALQKVLLNVCLPHTPTMERIRMKPVSTVYSTLMVIIWTLLVLNSPINKKKLFTK